MTRTRLLLATPLLLTLLLAGCVGIPTSGPVQTVPIDTDPDENPQIEVVEGPQPGQSAPEILQGFLAAGRGPQNNYNVAYEFLAPDADWRGTDRVLIANVSSVEPVQVDADTWSITLNVTAEVDAGGRYVSASSTQTLSYDFVEVDGEVRISVAAPGTVLSANGFSAAFAEYPLYFFDPSFRYLVPDLRWFPATPRSVADRIVTELLAGPSPWLVSPVLVSAFPTGTTGEADYRAPRVDVDLSAEVRSESTLAQSRMRQQLEQSLSALSNVTEVGVTSEGLTIAPSSGTPAETGYLVSDVVGGLDGRFGTLGEEGVAPITGIGTRADQLEPRQAALGRDRATAAVLGPEGVSLVPAEGPPVPIDTRGGLIAPTIDPFGYVWSVPAGDPGGLHATGQDGVVHDLPIDADGSVVAVELARDGSRLLVALSTPSGPRLFVAGVQRDADLAPVALGAPLALPTSGVIVDIAWMDQTHVAVLRRVDGETVVDLVALGGPVVSLGSVDDGVAIVGGNLQSGLRVLAADGSVLRPGAGGWVDTGLVASFLGTQQ